MPPSKASLDPSSQTITSCGALVWESTEATADPTVSAAW